MLSRMARRRENPLKTRDKVLIGGGAAVALIGITWALTRSSKSSTSGGGGGGGGDGQQQGPPPPNQPPPKQGSPPAPPGNGFNGSNPANFFGSVGDYANQLAKLGYNYQQIYNYLDYFGGVKMLKNFGIDLPTIQQIFSGIDLKSLQGALQGIDWGSLAGALKGIDLSAFQNIRIG
jgi:hypothetical protein